MKNSQAPKKSIKPDALLRLEEGRHRSRLEALKRKSDSTIQNLEKVESANNDYHESRERLMNVSSGQAPPSSPYREKKLYGGIGKLKFPKKSKR